MTESESRHITMFYGLFVDVFSVSVWIFQGTLSPASAGNGDGEIRTLDPLLARQVLSQLSYAPMGIYYFYEWA